MSEREIRRLVTGHDNNGRSKFIMDGAATSVLEVEAMGGLRVTDLWETFDSPADNRGEKDNADRDVHLEPGARGSIFRIVEFPPDSVWKDSGDGAAAFGGTISPALPPSDTCTAAVSTGAVHSALNRERQLRSCHVVVVLIILL